MYYALLTLFVIVALLLIVVTILQKGRGDVGAAFGASMGQSIFGAGGVDTVLTKATYWLGGIFLALALILSLVPKEEKGSILEKEEANEVKTAPAKPPAESEKGGTPPSGTPTQEKAQ